MNRNKNKHDNQGIVENESVNVREIKSNLPPGIKSTVLISPKTS